MNAYTQLLVVTIIICSFLSLLTLLLTFLTFPGSFGIGWSFLVLLQLISSYSGYRLLKTHQIKKSDILKYLKETNL